MGLAEYDFKVNGSELLAVLTGCYLSLLFFFQALSKVKMDNGTKLLAALAVGTILIGMADGIQGIPLGNDISYELRDIAQAIDNLR